MQNVPYLLLELLKVLRTKKKIFLCCILCHVLFIVLVHEDEMWISFAYNQKY